MTLPDWLQPWEGTPEALLAATEGQAPRRWLRGSRMRTKQGLLDEWAAAVQFPPHFGGTWDALRDALADLPEGGLFLVLEAHQLLQDAPPEEGALWLAVMQAVAEDLAPHPFQLVLQADSERYPALLEGLASLGGR